jgi:hypothetical protein
MHSSRRTPPLTPHIPTDLSDPPSPFLVPFLPSSLGSGARVALRPALRTGQQLLMSLALDIVHGPGLTSIDVRPRTLLRSRRGLFLLLGLAGSGRDGFFVVVRRPTLERGRGDFGRGVGGGRAGWRWGWCCFGGVGDGGAGGLVDGCEFEGRGLGGLGWGRGVVTMVLGRWNVYGSVVEVGVGAVG